MNTLILKRGGFLLLLLILINSCTPSDEVLPSDSNNQYENIDKPIVLGGPIENAYSLSNMKKAQKELQSQYTNLKKLDILPTHLYVKITPKDFDDLANLESLEELILFSYPLLYEVIEEGSYYHDPAVTVGKPTYQYSVIPIDFKLPVGTTYEVLEEVFMPELRSGAWDALEEKALSLVEKKDEGEVTLSKKKEKVWYPSGKVTLYDKELGENVPLVGLDVRAVRNLRVSRAYVSSTGTFKCHKKMKGNVRYWMYWKRGKFYMKNKDKKDLFVKGPVKTSSLNWKIPSKSKHYYYGLIFIPTYHYYYGDI